MLDIALECEASGAPGSDPQYTWSWSPTTNLTDHNTATPTFAVPDDVDQDTTWTYTVTATADNADDGAATVTVTVRDTDSTDPSLTCTDSEVYEGTADFTLDCENPCCLFMDGEYVGRTRIDRRYEHTYPDVYGARFVCAFFSAGQPQSLHVRGDAVGFGHCRCHRAGYTDGERQGHSFVGRGRTIRPLLLIGVPRVFLRERTLAKSTFVAPACPVRVHIGMRGGSAAIRMRRRQPFRF